MTVMAETSFGVKYQGPALEDGRMPVRDLAPALLALGEVFREAANELYPDLPTPTLEFQATERGSFDASLILSASDAWEQLTSMLTAKGPSALANLEAIVLGVPLAYGAADGLFKFIGKVGGRPIRAVENTDDPDRMRVILDDEVEIEAPAGTVKLYRNPKVRRAARDSIEPVKRPGIDSVEFRPEQDGAFVVERRDVDAFDLPTVEDGADELVTI